MQSRSGRSELVPVENGGFGSRSYPFVTERNRRGILLLFLLRQWQLNRGGQLPETLDQLVGETLGTVPVDPLSGSPFTLNRSGRPFPFMLRYIGIHQPDYVRANTPYLTCDEDYLELFVHFEDGPWGPWNEEDSMEMRRFGGPAWPVWKPAETNDRETPDGEG